MKEEERRRKTRTMSQLNEFYIRLQKCASLTLFTHSVVFSVAPGKHWRQSQICGKVPCVTWGQMEQTVVYLHCGNTLTLTACPLLSGSSPSADSSPTDSPAAKTITATLTNHSPLEASNTDQKSLSSLFMRAGMEPELSA